MAGTDDRDQQLHYPPQKEFDALGEAHGELGKSTDSDAVKLIEKAKNQLGAGGHMFGLLDGAEGAIIPALNQSLANLGADAAAAEAQQYELQRTVPKVGGLYHGNEDNTVAAVQKVQIALDDVQADGRPKG